MYNRRQRREMERSLGLFKNFKKMPKAQQEEIRKRRAETGKQIHLQNQQAREQYEIEFENQQYQKRVAFWERMGLTNEEAIKKTDQEYAADEAKWAK